MKTNGILITRKLLLTAFVLLLMVTFTKAQTSGADFNFINHSLISGSDRLAGAIYLFPNVRAGIDCRVTIVAITPGTSIPTLDDNSNGTGFVEAFQPRIQVNGRTRGYGEFSFRFVKAGTNNDTLVGEIPATSIDVDGNGSGPDSTMEFDEYFLPSAYIIDYDMLAGQLTFNWLLGSILGRHKAAIEYTGIDTIGRSVMFTIVYPHQSTFFCKNWCRQFQERKHHASAQCLFQTFHLSELFPADKEPSFIRRCVAEQWCEAELVDEPWS